MQRWLLLLFLFTSSALMAQKGYVFVKKNGRKVKTYVEGDYIRIGLNDGRVFSGYITMVFNDTVYLNRMGFHKNNISAIHLPQKQKEKMKLSAEQLLLITAGVGLSTLGMTASKWESLETALIYSSVIGYGPILTTMVIRRISFKRKQYRLGKKFAVELFDLHFPVNAAR